MRLNGRLEPVTGRSGWHMQRLSRWAIAVLMVGQAQAALAQRLELPAGAPTTPRELAIPRAGEPFDPYEALHGSRSSPAQCLTVPDGFWVEFDGKGDCIRAYSHGLNSAENPVVLVYFSGDVMLKTRTAVRFIAPGYERRSPDGLQRDMARWSREAGRPTIFLARPGMYGSSGDHNARRELREVMLMDRALNAIKNRYGVSRFILAGQSGGGQIAAALLNRRHDISAAALSSALLSVREVTRHWDKRRTVQSTNIQALHDPIDHVGRIPTQPRPSIVVLSDREDRIVPYESQLAYVRRLQATGFEPLHVLMTAADKTRHGLARHGQRAAAMMARGEPTATIRAELEKQASQANP